MKIDTRVLAVCAALGGLSAVSLFPQLPAWLRCVAAVIAMGSTNLKSLFTQIREDG